MNWRLWIIILSLVHALLVGFCHIFKASLSDFRSRSGFKFCNKIWIGIFWLFKKVFPFELRIVQILIFIPRIVGSVFISNLLLNYSNFRGRNNSLVSKGCFLSFCLSPIYKVIFAFHSNFFSLNFHHFCIVSCFLSFFGATNQTKHFFVRSRWNYLTWRRRGRVISFEITNTFGHFFQLAVQLDSFKIHDNILTRLFPHILIRFTKTLVEQISLRSRKLGLRIKFWRANKLLGTFARASNHVCLDTFLVGRWYPLSWRHYHIGRVGMRYTWNLSCWFDDLWLLPSLIHLRALLLGFLCSLFLTFFLHLRKERLWVHWLALDEHFRSTNLINLFELFTFSCQSLIQILAYPCRRLLWA